jgi:hypothetical protein
MSVAPQGVKGRTWGATVTARKGAWKRVKRVGPHTRRMTSTTLVGREPQGGEGIENVMLGAADP